MERTQRPTSARQLSNISLEKAAEFFLLLFCNCRSQLILNYLSERVWNMVFFIFHLT